MKTILEDIDEFAVAKTYEPTDQIDDWAYVAVLLDNSDIAQLLLGKYLVWKAGNSSVVATMCRELEFPDTEEEETASPGNGLRESIINEIQRTFFAYREEKEVSKVSLNADEFVNVLSDVQSGYMRTSDVTTLIARIVGIVNEAFEAADRVAAMY